MKKLLSKVVLPASLVAASLGLSLGAASAPASASSAVHERASTATVLLSGTILKLDRSKYLFWFDTGDRHVRVRYYHATSFSGGSSAMLTKGLDVKILGTYAGTATTLVKAQRIDVAHA